MTQLEDLQQKVRQFVLEKLAPLSKVELRTFLTKLQTEAEEAKTSKTNKDVKWELVDCYICLLAASVMVGLDHSNMEDMARQKLSTNMNRRWQQLEDGTFQHIEEEAV